jgi:hypothetical protein
MLDSSGKKKCRLSGETLFSIRGGKKKMDKSE